METTSFPEDTSDFQTIPVTENERQLISSIFKPNFVAKVVTFAETCPTYRRGRLFKMIEFANGNRPTSPPMTSPANDLAFNQNGGFGLTFSFIGKRSSRKTNPNRFSSPGINDNGIFGYQSTTKQFSRTMPSKSVAQVHLIVTKMVREDKVADVLLVSDDFQGIWQELARIVDNRGTTTQPNLNVRSRNIQTATTPRRTQFIKSLRLDDPTMKDMYKSDSRWSPRLTVPRPT